MVTDGLACGKGDRMAGFGLVASPVVKSQDMTPSEKLLPSDPAGFGSRPASRGDVLSFARGEIEKNVPAGHPIIMVVENGGGDANEVVAKLDGCPITLAREPDVSGARGRLYLKYPNDPKLLGQVQVMELSFLALNGVRDTHRYEMKHGQRWLKRVDPA